MLTSRLRLQEMLMHAVDDKERFFSIIEELKPNQLVPVQTFLWDYTIDLSCQCEKPLTREDITGKLEGTYEYQLRMGCTEPVEYCRANFCVMSNPNCAGEKLRNSIQVLRNIICDLKTNSH